VLRFRITVLCAVAAALTALTALAALAAAPVATAAGGGSIYGRVLNAYQTRGTVPPCEFTSEQLERALKGIDTYGAQYFQDFASAVQGALTSRASGTCSGAGGGLPAPGAAGDVPAAPLRLGPVGAATGSSLPAPLVIMVLLAALLAIAAATATLVRWRGWEPPWGGAWAHAWGEAGYRLHSGWLDFRDWLRSGSEAGPRSG
jgi:hypothetical protein